MSAIKPHLQVSPTNQVHGTFYLKEIGCAWVRVYVCVCGREDRMGVGGGVGGGETVMIGKAAAIRTVEFLAPDKERRAIALT